MNRRTLYEDTSEDEEDENQQNQHISDNSSETKSSMIMKLANELHISESELPSTKIRMSRHTLVGLIGHNAMDLTTGKKQLSIPYQSLPESCRMDYTAQSIEEFRQGELNSYLCIIPEPNGKTRQFTVSEMEIDLSHLDPVVEEPRVSGFDDHPLYFSKNAGNFFFTKDNDKPIIE